MPEDTADVPKPTASSGAPTRRSSTGIVVASIAAAVSAFVIQWAVGRFSSAELTAEFLVFWSLVFAGFGIVGGVRNETTRAVGSARRHGASGPRAMTAALIMGGATALLALLTAPLWAERLVPSTTPVIVPVIALAILSYACHVTMTGALSGREAWSHFSALMMTESLLRLVLVGVALLAAGGLLALEVAVALSALTWLGLLLVSPEFRRAASERTDVPLGRLLKNNLFSIASSVSSSALITGFPVLLQLTGQDADAAVLASTIFAISFTRSPIMIPLQAFQGVAIVAFLRSERNPLGALVKPLGALAGLGVVGAVAAGLLGPWLMDVLFAGKYEVSAATFAGLMIAAATLAMLTLTGTAALAKSAHLGYTGGWTIASVAAFGLLFLPLPLAVRAVVALIMGPLAGLAVHLVSIVVTVRRQAALRGALGQPTDGGK